MSNSPAPAARLKMSPLVRIIVVVCGIAAMIAGIIQIKKGVGEIAGAKLDPEVERLMEESDAALAEGNRHILAAAPLLQSALDAVDKDGLAAVRAQQAADLQKAGQLFGNAAEQLHLAARKLNDAAAHKEAGAWKPMFDAKARSYQHYAASKTINQEICRMLLDESLKTIDEVTPKILEAAKRRDEIEAKGNEATAQAKQIADEMKK